MRDWERVKKNMKHEPTEIGGKQQQKLLIDIVETSIENDEKNESYERR